MENLIGQKSLPNITKVNTSLLVVRIDGKYYDSFPLVDEDTEVSITILCDDLPNASEILMTQDGWERHFNSEDEYYLTIVGKAYHLSNKYANLNVAIEVHETHISTLLKDM